MALSDDQRAMLRLLAQRRAGIRGHRGADGARASTRCAPRSRDALAQLERGRRRARRRSPPAEPAEPAAPSRLGSRRASARAGTHGPRQRPPPPPPDRPPASPSRPKRAAAPMLTGAWLRGARSPGVVVIAVLADPADLQQRRRRLGRQHQRLDRRLDQPGSAATTAAATPNRPGGAEPRRRQRRRRRRAIFGRVKNTLVLAGRSQGPRADRRKAPPTRSGSPSRRRKCCRSASTAVAENGRDRSARSKSRPNCSLYLANETYNDIAITRTDNAPWPRRRRRRKTKAPTYTGEAVLRGTDHRPDRRRRRAAQKAEEEAAAEEGE